MIETAPVPFKQTRRNNCSQTCVAMITGKNIKEINKLYGKARAYRMAEILRKPQPAKTRAVISTTYLTETTRVMQMLGYNIDSDFIVYDDGERYPIFHRAAKTPPAFESGKTYLVRVAWFRRGKARTGRTHGGHCVVYRDGWFYDPIDGMLSAKPPENSKITDYLKIWK